MSIEIVDYELYLIGCLLQDDSVLAQIKSQIRPIHFHDPLNRLLYETIIDENVFDPVILFDKTKDAKSSVRIAEAINEAIGTGRIDWVCRKMRERHGRKAAKRALDEAGMKQNNGEDMLEVIDELNGRAETLLSELHSTDTDPKPVSLSLGSVMEDIQRNSPAIKIKWPDLDKALCGLRPGLYVLGAPPAAGKTTFAFQLACDILSINKDVVSLYVSYEVSEDRLLHKALARAGSLDAASLIDADKRIESFWPMITKASGQVFNSTSRLYVKYDPSMSVSSIGLIAQRLQECSKKKLVVFIDALQNIQPEKTHRTRRDEINEIVNDLMQLRMKNDCPIVLLSHHSRLSGQKNNYPPNRGMGACKESGHIEFSADVVMNLDVPENETDEDDNPVRARILHLCKNRYGPSCKVIFDFDMQRAGFSERTLWLRPDV